MEIVKPKRHRLTREETHRLKAMLEGTYDGYKYNVAKCVKVFGVSDATIYKLMRTSPSLQSRVRSKRPKSPKTTATSNTASAPAPEPDHEPEPAGQQPNPQPTPLARPTPDVQTAPAPAWKPGQSCLYQDSFGTVKHLLSDQRAQVELDDYRSVCVPITELSAPRCQPDPEKQASAAA